MVAVDWKTSAAKQVILDDLNEKVLPADRNELSARRAWKDVYCHMVEFHGIECEQYRENLNRMRKSHLKKLESVDWTREAINHDKKFRKSMDSSGKKLFYLSEAAKKLRKDVKKGKHLEMKPKELRQTRPECVECSLKVFREHIYQQVRRFKFELYLEEKRTEHEEQRKTTLQNRNHKFSKRRRISRRSKEVQQLDDDSSVDESGSR